MDNNKKCWYLLLRVFWLHYKYVISKRETRQWVMSSPKLKIFQYFLISLDPKSWNLALIGRAKAIVLMQTIVIYLWVYIFYISYLVTARVYLLSLNDRGPQVKCRLSAISYIYKCLLVPSVWHFRIFSWMFL